MEKNHIWVIKAYDGHDEYPWFTEYYAYLLDAVARVREHVTVDWDYVEVDERPNCVTFYGAPTADDGAIVFCQTITITKQPLH